MQHYSNNHLRIMVDAPKEVDIVRSKVLEKAHPEIKEKHPKYYAEPDIINRKYEISTQTDLGRT